HTRFSRDWSSDVCSSDLGGKREDVLNDENPAIVMATSGMLEGGPSVEYFKELAPNPKNKIMFVSYQINGTLGRRVLDGTMSEVRSEERRVGKECRSRE